MSEGGWAARRRTILVGGAVFAATLVVHLPALRNGFVNWDDDIYVTGNPAIRDPGPGLLRYAFLEFHAANWHPATWLSHAADVAIWGLDPVGHHLTSVLLHAANSLLVFLVALGLLRVALGDGPRAPDRRSGEETLVLGAAVTALLFGLHPIHVESVAWISERKDVLSAFFYLASLLAWMNGLRGEGAHDRSPRRRTWAGAGLLLYVLALLSKPMAVTLPAVLAILNWYPYRALDTREGRAGALRTIGPYVGLASGAVVLAALAQRASGAVVGASDVGILERLLVASNAAVTYLGKLLWPADLLPFYPHPRSAVLGSPRHLLAAGAVVVVTFACVWLARRQPWWGAAWASYLAMLAPVLGIVQVGGQSMADRYMYLPSIPPLLLLGAGTTEVARRAVTRRRPAIAAVLAVACIGASVATIRQIAVWRSSIALWSHVLEREPVTVPLAYYNRGQAYLEQGDTQRAIADYTAAISLHPGYREAWHNRAAALEARGEIGRAVEDYRVAVRLDPSDPLAHNSLGVALARAGRPEAALPAFDEAIRLSPGFASAWFNRALTLGQLGRPEEAAQGFQAACERGMATACAHLERGPGTARDSAR